MNRTDLRVFLSSTFADLSTEREAVEAVIHRMALTYVGMEHFGSFASEPLEECINKVRASNVVILALGNRYGSKPEGKIMSFTEVEYREANRLKKPVLAYFASYPTDRRIADEPPELRRLKDDVSKQHGVSLFESAEDLSWKVACDLYRELPRLPSDDGLELKGRTQELASLFRRRADVIERNLGLHYKYASVKTYLDEFRLLHAEHLSFLSQGNLILAHEVVNRIHHLSYRLERDEFWARHRIETPGLSYMLRPDAFEHGWITQRYADADATQLFIDVLKREPTKAKR